jgi:IclR family KDG regulon transcriptional repressor
MPRIAGRQEEGVQAAVLALRLVEYIAREGRPVGVTALSQALGTTKSRIFRHLQTLVQHQFLIQDEDTERYEIGPRFIALSRMAGANVDLVGAAIPVLRHLRDMLGHFTVLSQVESDGVRVLVAESGRSPIEIGVKRGSVLAFHGSAQGKIALAFGDPKVRDAVLRSRLEMLTPHTIVSAARLEKEIERIRTRGWSDGYNESLLGLNALAAPVFDGNGRLVATVGVVDSIQFIQQTPSAEQVNQIVAAGRRISAMLGHAGPAA